LLEAARYRACASRGLALWRIPLLCEEGNAPRQPVLFFAGTGTPGIFTLTEKRVLLVVK